MALERHFPLFYCSDIIKIAGDRCEYYERMRHSTLAGKVNCKNCVHLMEENHHGVASVSLYDRYVTMWCGVENAFILAPYFLNDVTSSGVEKCYIRGARYKAILENYEI